MRSLFKVTFSFFLQNSELGSFQCIRWKGSAVGNISHRTCLFFDLLKHGLEIVNHYSSVCLYYCCFGSNIHTNQSSNQLAFWKIRCRSRVRIEVRVEGVKKSKNSLELLTSGGKFLSTKIPSGGPSLPNYLLSTLFLPKGLHETGTCTMQLICWLPLNCRLLRVNYVLLIQSEIYSAWCSVNHKIDSK